MKISFDHFNWLAPIYEMVIRPGDLDDFWKVVDLPERGFLLDAGGGTGRISQQAKQKTACEIVVSDLSFSMLREASVKGELQPVNTPAEILPFMDNQFDRIIMVDALHHVLDQKKTARELWRVLKPGGSIVVEEPDIRKFTVKLIALGEKIAMMRSHFLLPDMIASLFQFPEAKSEIIQHHNNVWVKITRNY
jgi:ubiquinone/menaquinone biosynthesis C-methylase UbiE